MLAAIAGAVAAADVAGRFLNRNTVLALGAGAIAVAVLAGGLAGLVWLRADAARDATAAVTAAAEVRRLEAEAATLRAAIARSERILTARTLSIETQEHEIAELQRQINAARAASRVDRSSPVVPADDPWLRHGAAARTPAGSVPGGSR